MIVPRPESLPPPRPLLPQLQYQMILYSSNSIGLANHCSTQGSTHRNCSSSMSKSDLGSIDCTPSLIIIIHLTHLFYFIQVSIIYFIQVSIIYFIRFALCSLFNLELYIILILPFMGLSPVVLCMLLLFTSTYTQNNYLGGLSIDPLLLAQTNNALDMLKLKLPSFNWIFTNKQGLYNSVVVAMNCISQIRDQLKQYNNAISGQGNTVLGSSNIVIGSMNNLLGSNNWVFTSNYSSTALNDGELILGSWIINLKNLTSIPIDPRQAISVFNNSQFQQKYNQLMTSNPFKFFC